MTHAVPGRDKPADTRGTQTRPVQPKPPPRAHLNPAAAMALQRQAGNRAVANLVTPQEPVVQRGILDDVAGVAGDVKGRVLGQFGTWARRIPGYGVLCVALGKDPITEQPVARDATAVVGALVGLVPGGAALWENLQQSGAVAKAGEWLAAELPKLGLTWESIRSLFSRAWDAVSVTDLIDPGAVWDRLSGIFSAPIARLRAFAAAAGTKLMELVFEGVLGGAGGIGGQVMGIIHRAGDVLGTIVRDPIGFAGNLVTAVRGGLGQFVTNILSHLRTGLFGWLTGALRGAVQIPQRFDFGGILSMVASMLGLTWSWLRERLVRTLGERTVHLVETGVDWVRDIATRGMAAVSQRLSDMASGFVDTVIGGIRDWVANSIVGAAITRLISMFNPAGAVIQAILAVYNTIRFFIERAQQLGALAESVFGSIAAIASGSLDAAKNAVESALGRAVPVVLGFLARLIGLGDVAAPVRNIITRIRGAVDRAADRVIGWVSGVARRLTGRGEPGAATREDARSSAQKEAAVASAVEDVEKVMDRPGSTRRDVEAALPNIKNRHQLNILTVEGGAESYHVHAEINPKKDTRDKKGDKPFTLAPGGYPKYEDEILAGGHDIHLMRKHVTISDENLRARVEGLPAPVGATTTRVPPPGEHRIIKQASRFINEKIMQESLDAAIRGNDSKIQKEFLKNGKAAEDGTSLVIEWNCGRRIGEAFRLVEKPSHNRPEDNPQAWGNYDRNPLNAQTRPVEEVTEVLKTVEAVLRIRSGEERTFVVQTAYPK